MSLKLPPLKWLPSPNYSARTAKMDLIVVHDCQGGYSGSIGLFQSRTGGPAGPVSAHLVLREDGGEATQMVAFDKKAWHCAAFNSRSIGLELAGFEERGYSDAEWGAAESIVAYLLHRYNIPAQWSRGGAGPGFCRHYDLGRAGGSHTDPTTDERLWAGFVAKVQEIVAAGDFPDSWDAAPGAHPLAVPAQASTGIVVGAEPVLRLWSTGDAVADLQGLLNTNGATPKVSVDRDFGKATQASVIAFQKAHKLGADGVVGPETWTVLHARVKAAA